MSETALETRAFAPVQQPSNVYPTSSPSAHLSSPHDPLSPANIATTPARDAALKLDICGFITYCSAAAAVLLGQSAERLTGQAVGRVIHKLPLGALTPGYNLAFTTFNSAQGLWLKRQVMLPGGGLRPMEVSLASARVDGKHCITLGLRPVAPAGAANS